MTISNLTSSRTPQTAADLLDGLLRSQLFAESIYGQIFEQSRLFLNHPAPEYAAALIQRKVLTAWQASELLAGRSNFYSGTFRLLGRLATGSQSSVFIAEQSGAQRLVLLEAGPLASTTSNHSGAGLTTPPTEKPFGQASNHHPHLARCLQVQTTATQQLVAYEFIEAMWLKDVIAQQSPKRTQVAHLILQLAQKLSALSREALKSPDLLKVLISSNGQLKWLAGPRTLVNDWPENEAITAQRVTAQMLAIRKFTKFVGGQEGIGRCQNLQEVVTLLELIAEPWTDAFPPESIRSSRAVLNRMLRKGPSLKQIESLHSNQQLALTTPASITTPATLVASLASPAVVPAPAIPNEPALAPVKSRQPTAETSRQNDLASPIEPLRRQSKLLMQLTMTAAKSTLSLRTQSKTLLLTAVIGAVVSGFVAMQWMWRWSTPEAKAQTETIHEAPDTPSESQ